MSLVCATDFSESSREAADIAAGIASRLGESLLLLHVIEMPTFGSLAGELVMLPPPGLAGGSAAEKLAAETRRLGATGVRVTPRLAIGEIAQELANAAREARAPMIVCGSHQRWLPGRWILGSVGDRLVRASDVPVLVVRGEKSELAAWSRRAGPLDVLVAIGDYDGPTSFRAAADHLELASDCRFHYATVIEVPSFSTTPASEVGGEMIAAAVDPVADAERMLRARIQAASLPDPASRLRILTGRPAGEIAELATAISAGVVMIGTHQLSKARRLGSVAEAILNHATVPVLIVPVHA